jgi:hypothetical protein
MAARADGGSGCEMVAAGCRAPQLLWKAAGVREGLGSRARAGGVTAGGGGAADGSASMLRPSRSSSEDMADADAGADVAAGAARGCTACRPASEKCSSCRISTARHSRI